MVAGIARLQALAKAERRGDEDMAQNHKKLLDALPVAISHVDPDQCYRFNNAAFEKLFGIAHATALSRSMREVLPRQVYHTVEPHIRAALAGEEAHFTYTLSVPSRGRRSFDVHCVPDVTGIYIVSNDITEHEEAKRALRQSEARFRGVVESVPGGVRAGSCSSTVRWRPCSAMPAKN
jgi:PAS domain S-box-containing protein